MGASCSNIEEVMQNDKFFKDFKDTSLTLDDGILLKRSFHSLAKQSMAIGSICEQRLIQEMPEAAAILNVNDNGQQINRPASRFNSTIGQGVIFMKGIGLFVSFSTDPVKMKQCCDRLAKKHVERYNLTASRMAYALHLAEPIFIEQALGSNYRGDKDDLLISWKKLFKNVKDIFLSIDKEVQE